MPWLVIFCENETKYFIPTDTRQTALGWALCLPVTGINWQSTNDQSCPLPLSQHSTLGPVTALHLPEAGKYDFNFMCQKWRGKLVSKVYTKICRHIGWLQDFWASWPHLQNHISLYPTSSKDEMINITFLASANRHHQSNYTGLCCFLHKINSNVIFQFNRIPHADKIFILHIFHFKNRPFFYGLYIHFLNFGKGITIHLKMFF